jgi:S1-C subfamily serine protease
MRAVGFSIVATLLASILASGAEAQHRAAAPAVEAFEQMLVDAIDSAGKSVVAIARVDPLDPRRRRDPLSDRPRTPAEADFVPDHFGTGVVVDRAGLILTQYHVVAKDSEHYVTTPDRKYYRARIKGADPRSDLALLEINATDLTPIRFGDTSNLKRGQIVIALGNPYAIARDGQASASWGIIANLSRKMPTATSEGATDVKDKLHHFGTLIQTDAKLNLGTSGGALVNRKGEMIGLTTSLAATAGYEQAAGYAIPVDDVFRRAVETMKQGREVEYGFLGIQPKTLDEAERALGLTGVRVDGVVSGTPADRFGLQMHDLITHVDGHVVDDADALMLQVGRKPVDSQVSLTVLRRGGPQRIKVELTKFPVRGTKIVSSPLPAWRGLQVDYSTALPVELNRVRLPELLRDGCVAITEVDRDSPAWEAKLQTGMFITHVGSRRVRSPKEFRTAILGKDGPIELRIFTAGQETAPETRVIKPNAE